MKAPVDVAKRLPALRVAEGFPGQRLILVPPAVRRRARTLPVCRDLQVTHIGAFHSAPGHYVDRRGGVAEQVLLVCQSGRGHCLIGRKAYELTSGHAIVLPPGVSHRYWADPSDPWTLFWVHFEGRCAADHVRMLGLSPRRPLCWLHDLPVVTEAFEQVYGYARGGYSDGELYGLSTGLARLFGVCRNARRSLDTRRRHAEEQVLKTLHFMTMNLHRSLSLGELAAVAAWSPTHYSTVFRRHLNLSPVEYLLRLRIQRACDLLRTTDDRVADVATRVGISDPFYFSRLFRKRVGSSPKAYRDAYGAGAALSGAMGS